jgi:hypothetical protein
MIGLRERLYRQQQQRQQRQAGIVRFWRLRFITLPAPGDRRHDRDIITITDRSGFFLKVTNVLVI